MQHRLVHLGALPVGPVALGAGGRVQLLHPRAPLLRVRDDERLLALRVQKRQAAVPAQLAVGGQQHAVVRAWHADG
jgi:hypothetical protein